MRLELLTVDRLRYDLARVGRWYRTTKEGDRIPAAPPELVVRDMLAHPDPPLPTLVQRVQAPFFSPGGRLVVQPGYHATSGTYYTPGPGLEISPVPAAPAELDVAHARDVIAELLYDFPFTSDTERAHAIVALVQPFIRPMITGPTPLFLIEKPSPGTGAGLLAEAVAWPALGQAVPVITQAREEEEWRKRLTALIVRASPIVLLDNLTGKLESAALSAVLTTTVWQDRKLGTHDVGEWPVRCTWLATANNLVVSTDMARRVIRIRLDAKMERPFERQAFRHVLPTWAQENRADLVWAALVLGQAWVTAGRPAGHAVLGRFESWARTMGGILEVAGIPGFLANANESYDAADLDGAAMRVFVAQWWERFASDIVSSAKLFPLATDDASSLVLEGRDDHAKRTTLGQLLARCRDRRYDLPDGLTVAITSAPGKRQGATAWRLAPTVAGLPPTLDLTAPDGSHVGSPAKPDPAGGTPTSKGAANPPRRPAARTAADAETNAGGASREEDPSRSGNRTDPASPRVAGLSQDQTDSERAGPNGRKEPPDPDAARDPVGRVEPPW